MKNLYIDFDGVLMDTMTTSYRMMDESQIDKNDREAILEFYRTLNWEEIIEISTILNDSINRLQKIKDSKKFDISILTHINSLEEIIEKVKFIRTYFHDITIIACPKQISKTKMVDANDSILIDDYAENLKEWEEAGGFGVKFSPTMNDRGYKCIDHIDQILDLEF